MTPWWASSTASTPPSGTRRPTHLAEPFDAEDLAGKAAAGRDLIADCGWQPNRDPVIGMVTRLTAQKGVDLAIDMIDYLARFPAHMVILGSGDRELAERAHWATVGRAEVARFVEGYDESLSHRIFAGSDLLLMPSRFEPCGLAQMQAMIYGTIPVVTDVGGLRDTVIDSDLHESAGTGFVAGEVTPMALLDAISQGHPGVAFPHPQKGHPAARHAPRLVVAGARPPPHRAVRGDLPLDRRIVCHPESHPRPAFMATVRWWRTGVSVGAGPNVVAVGSAPVSPASFVFGPVMKFAERCQVPFEGGSAVGVASGVVEVGGTGGSAASGEHAGTVPCPDLPSLRRCRKAPSNGHRQRVAVVVDDGGLPAAGGLTVGDLAGDVGHHRTPPTQLTGVLGQPQQGAQIHREVHHPPTQWLGVPGEEVDGDVAAALIHGPVIAREPPGQMVDAFPGSGRHIRRQIQQQQVGGTRRVRFQHDPPVLDRTLPAASWCLQGRPPDTACGAEIAADR